MAESQFLCKPQKLLSDSDMEAAAQQLMQLSDEDNNSENDKSNNSNKKKKKNLDDRDEITLAKIEEIFGKEEEVFRPKRKRYRSLESIYMTTKPMPLEMGRRLMY